MTADLVINGQYVVFLVPGFRTVPQVPSPLSCYQANCGPNELIRKQAKQNVKVTEYFRWCPSEKICTRVVLK